MKITISIDSITKEEIKKLQDQFLSIGGINLEQHISSVITSEFSELLQRKIKPDSVNKIEIKSERL